MLEENGEEMQFRNEPGGKHYVVSEVHKLYSNGLLHIKNNC